MGTIQLVQGSNPTCSIVNRISRLVTWYHEVSLQDKFLIGCVEEILDFKDTPNCKKTSFVATRFSGWAKSWWQRTRETSSQSSYARKLSNFNSEEIVQPFKILDDELLTKLSNQIMTNLSLLLATKMLSTWRKKKKYHFVWKPQMNTSGPYS